MGTTTDTEIEIEIEIEIEELDLFYIVTLFNYFFITLVYTTTYMLDSFFNGSFFENVDQDDSYIYYKQNDNQYYNNPILQDNTNQNTDLESPQKSVTWKDANDSYSISSSNDTYIQPLNKTSCKYKYYLLFAIIILTTSIGFFFFYK